MTHNPIPNPGSNEAVDLGCTCPIMDNHYGAGYANRNGLEAVFVINADCPLHGGTVPEPEAVKHGD